jgi:dTDP-glucose 4,6-dehydratase
MAKPIVVIGSNCFTGSHIVDALLTAGHSVIGISRSPEYLPVFLPYAKNDRSRFTFTQLDITQQLPGLLKLLDRLKPERIINVAALSEVALSNDRPVEYFETNTLAVVKLVHHLRQTGYVKHYIHISSAEIFGPCDTPLNEEAPFSPSTPYAASKAAADMFINTMIARFNFPATLIRSTNVYGAHQQLFKIIPRTAIYIRTGQTLQLHGGGTSMKSFIHIRDVVDGLMKTLDQHALGTFHFSDPSDRTVRQVVEMVCQQMNVPFEKVVQVVGERPGQDSRYWLNCSKAHTQLGWKPQVRFEDGVRETLQWIDENWNVLRQQPTDYIHQA